VSVYSATNQEIDERQAARARAATAARRRRELIRGSDDLLERQESLSLAKFGAVKATHFDAIASAIGSDRPPAKTLPYQLSC
jgi:hypothetical protein